MSDLASFNQADLSLIWGYHPSCQFCGKPAHDFHHICGRSNKKNPEMRKIHSSVLNAAPLCRGCHDGKLHDVDTRTILLDKVEKQVKRSEYLLNNTDILFLEKYGR